MQADTTGTGTGTARVVPAEVNASEIQVEDPVNFLSSQEKQEYMLAHQETIARGEIPLDKLSDLSGPQKEAMASFRDMQGDYGRPRDEIYDGPDDLRPQDNRRPDIYAVEEEMGRSVPRHDLQQSSERAERQKSERREGYERRTGSVNSNETREDDEVRYRDYDDRSGLEKGLSAAVKFGLLVIVLLLLTMVFFLFLPSIKSAIGLDGDGTAGTALTLSEGELQAAGEETQSVQTGGSSQGSSQTTEQQEEGGAQTADPNARTVTVTADELNLRDLPGWMEGSEVICKAKRGEKLTVISEEDGWLKVSYNGQELFCSEEFVE